MNRRWFAIFAIVVLILAMLVYFHFNGLVFVDSKPVLNVQLDFVESGKQILVPVVATLCELGYEKISKSNDIIELHNNDQTLTLDLKSLTLMCPQSPVNCIGPMPGNSYDYCERKDNEIWIDITTFAGTLVCIECNYVITLADPTTRIVRFTYRQRIDAEQFIQEFLESLPQESTSPKVPDIITEGRLIVNGVDITEGNYVYINHTAKNTELPVLAILQALGYDAEMVFNDSQKSYCSKIGNLMGHFTTQSEDFGVPFSSGEKSCVRKIESNDFIIDGNCINSILYWGFGARLTVDYDSSTIFVDSCDPWA